MTRSTSPRRWARACGISQRFVVGLGLLLGAAACSAAQTPVGQDDKSRSLAEYDIARDLWLNRGQPREALEHALTAIQLDDENAEVAHLAALLYLDFCRQSAG